MHNIKQNSISAFRMVSNNSEDETDLTQIVINTNSADAATAGVGDRFLVQEQENIAQLQHAAGEQGCSIGRNLVDIASHRLRPLWYLIVVGFIIIILSYIDRVFGTQFMSTNELRDFALDFVQQALKSPHLTNTTEN